MTVQDAADKIRVARLASGLTYEAFARAVGIGKASLSRYENRLQPVPHKVEMAVVGVMAQLKENGNG